MASLKIQKNRNRRAPRQAQNMALLQHVELSHAPPQFQSAVVYGKVLRFQTNAPIIFSAPLLVTAQNLLDLLFMATGVNAGARLVSSLKLKRVRMWGPMASTLVPVTVSCEYTDGSATTTASFGSTKSRSDTSMGAERCAFLDYKPPDGTLASFWQSGASTQPLFQIICPVNTIIDLQLTMVLLNDDLVVALQHPAIVAGTVGQIYCGGLDGLRLATTVVPPVNMLNL